MLECGVQVKVKVKVKKVLGCVVDFVKGNAFGSEG